MNSEKMALVYARPVYTLTNLLYPLSFLFDKLSKALIGIFQTNGQERPAITENELRTILDLSHEEGVIETEEKEMIYNVFDLGDAKAKDVMVPRVHVTFADVESTYCCRLW